MASDLKEKAKEAFVDDNFELAVELYTQALDMDPRNADLFADRAQANLKLNNFTEAVADASRAIELDPSISKAYLRKGTACIKLEEFQTAKAALEAGASLVPGDSRFSKLIRECDELIAEENRTAVVPKVMSIPSSSVSPLPDRVTNSPNDLEPLPVATPSAPKYRHDHYNTPTEVVLTIFAKGIPSENVHVDFGEQILSVSIDVSNEESYHFQPRLFSKIVPDKCRYAVLSSKIEIRLFKADPISWTSLEFRKDNVVPQKINAPSASVSERPTYPSSKSKIDWDKLEAEVKKELFRDLYQDADEDTRRAMKKSFVESNGTVLSTNWKEVGSKKVEGSPPQGMEMRKWET
ncbi:unnamed protein product [Spirodela intermedia]|uniref:Protein SGT1 homolog n=1 Tax=Spirodela intermedia TaxID=51605 RepID=A0A7I8JTX4_SPIIN|nr:unnamed protein product [Spirodela intermedia]CAA6672902.1 unnamed protein product [Spirodela intermedia]